MARQARCLQNTNIYHTIVRGNNSEDIFSDNCEKRKIEQILYDKSSYGAFDIIAYCILCDHAHFIIKENSLSIAEAMKRINTSYAAFYNKKNSRRGHVFYSRYLSEGICDNKKLLKTINYILHHPSKEEESIALKTKAKDIYECINSCLSMDDVIAGYECFLKYLKNKDEYDYIMDVYDPNEDIAQAKALLNEYFNATDMILSALMRREYLHLRTQMVLYLKQNTNLSIRKIAEVLSLNRGIVYKIICDYKD